MAVYPEAAATSLTDTVVPCGPVGPSHAVDVSISGTFVATVALQRYLAGQWVTIRTYTAPQEDSVLVGASDVLSRLICTSYTSGTVVAAMQCGEGRVSVGGPGTLSASSAIIGKVGIDQATPGVTNGVVASPVAIATATHSNVSAANADTALLASNASRKPGSTIVNDSTAILYIKLGSGASATSYMVAVDGKTTVGGIFPVPDGYTGAVNGFWASATGAARVMEMT